MTLTLTITAVSLLAKANKFQIRISVYLESLGEKARIAICGYNFSKNLNTFDNNNVLISTHKSKM